MKFNFTAIYGIFCVAVLVGLVLVLKLLPKTQVLILKETIYHEYPATTQSANEPATQPADEPQTKPASDRVVPLQIAPDDPVVPADPSQIPEPAAMHKLKQLLAEK